MIYDDIKNIKSYNIISDNVIAFLINLNSEINTGRYDLGNGIYANVDIYNTKSAENCYFESHRKYIDIQIVLSGKERLDYTDIKNLKVKEEYDENRDIMFYYNPHYPKNTIQLLPGKFALLYPHEAHKPQLQYENVSEHVKKVVIKIPIM